MKPKSQRQKIQNLLYLVLFLDFVAGRGSVPGKPRRPLFSAAVSRKRLASFSMLAGSPVCPICMFPFCPFFESVVFPARLKF
ncbi:hypothetical protein H8693_03295 [Christensenellaceae bacterium NSJ-63]|uniref:Uncharacterized protein n=1 Tax=Guopingia tenuis TaxID=2763656 RepID=A0A926DGX8_9FIRM|nr:hypothetical protein [Guopingia tenuis]MBC8537961.1 hypothetical protein [Guopingia tenuis]